MGWWRLLGIWTSCKSILQLVLTLPVAQLYLSPREVETQLYLSPHEVDAQLYLSPHEVDNQLYLSPHEVDAQVIGRARANISSRTRNRSLS